LVTGYAGNVYPRVVRAVTGGPDHDAGVQAASVCEPDGAPFRAGHRGPEPDPGRPKPASAAADDEVGPGPQPASQPGPGGDPHQAEPGEPPEQVLAASRCGSTGALVAIDSRSRLRPGAQPWKGTP